MTNRKIVIPAVGSLIGTRYSSIDGSWLGLVVDQSAGQKWADRDPIQDFKPEANYGPLLVRVLGKKTTEGGLLVRSNLPEEEPNQDETVRWVYVQTIPPNSFVVAEPDVSSIRECLKWYHIFNRFNMHASFRLDVALLAEYLEGVKRTPDKISLYEKRFFAMLEDVLPQQRG
jgi:hypothetical protein